MTICRRLFAAWGLMTLSGCALIFGHPMTEDEFVEADKKCDMEGATLIVGSFLKGSPSIIEAPRGAKPSGWDGKLECMARLFGGDGVSKDTSNNFIIRFAD